MEMRGAICIFIFIQLFPPPHLIPLWPLSVAGGWMCVMSTESNGKLLKFSPNHLSSPNFYLLTTESLSSSGQWLAHSWLPGGIGQLSSYSNNFKINIFIVTGNWKKCWLVAPQVRTVSPPLLSPELVSSLVSSEYSEQSFKPGSG